MNCATLKLRHTGSPNPGGGSGPMITENLSCTLSTLQDQTLFTFPQGGAPKDNDMNNTPDTSFAPADIAAMRYIVRRLTPTECERLMGLPDGYTIPVGLRRFFDADGEPSPVLVSEFVDIFDTFERIMYEYAHANWEREMESICVEDGDRIPPEPKPPKPKTAAQVQNWLAKISDPETCPDSPRYKACGNGQATNQPRWITLRLLAVEGIDPFHPEENDNDTQR